MKKTEIEKKKKTIQIEKISSIACDFCKKEISDKKFIIGGSFFGPITTFSISPGYGSCFDTDRYEFEICDDCLEKLVRIQCNDSKYIL